MVENKPGAIQTIGLAEVLRQPADGYTLARSRMSIFGGAGPATQHQIAARDRLYADHQAASAYHVLVVHPSVPAKSLAEFVAMLKGQPDKLTFSSGGFGTSAHLAGEMFKLQTGVRSTHVPYQALPRAIADLINGTNQFQFMTPLPVIDLIATGKLRAIAITGPARLPALKDVPTVGEAGFPDLIIQDWFGILAKAGTPNEHHRAPERSHEQSIGEATRARRDRKDGRRTSRRYTAGVRPIPAGHRSPIGVRS